MSSVDVFPHQRLLNTHCVALMAQVHSVTPLPIKNHLSHENHNNRHLLEKGITFQRQGFFTTSTYSRLCIIWQVIWWTIFNVACVLLENINYLIFSSYLHPFHDEILTTVFILFNIWLLIITVNSKSDLQPSTAIAN